MECCGNIIKPKPMSMRDLNRHTLIPELVYVEWWCPDCDTVMRHYIGSIDNRLAVNIDQ